MISQVVAMSKQTQGLKDGEQF